MQQILLSCGDKIMTPEQAHRFIWTKVSEYRVTRKQLKEPHQVILRAIMKKYNLHLLENDKQTPPILLEKPYTIEAKQYFYAEWLFAKNGLQMACVDAIYQINDAQNIRRDCNNCPVKWVSEENAKILYPNVCHGCSDYSKWCESRSKIQFKKYALYIANLEWTNKIIKNERCD